MAAATVTTLASAPERSRRPRVADVGPHPVHLVVLGAGNVGGHLLAQIHGARGAIARDEGLDLRVVAVLTRRAGLVDAGGIDLAAIHRDPPAPLPAAELDPWHVVDAVAHLPRVVLVDCTAASGVESLYVHALRRGVAVVTANKAPLATSLGRWAELARAARSAGLPLGCETTVGADLPVHSAIADRRRSGDHIVRIEGSLSGTLGFLADRIGRGESLSLAVEQARARGFTEPDPAEDLAGRDVARKALILARAIGLEVAPEDVVLEPFVPRDVLDHAARTGDLASSLARIDEPTTERARALASQGKVLRYLATIDPAAPRPVRVGPTEVPLDHPAATLRGTENLVALHTVRCGEVPVVIRGPGAGGAVTASGVLADVMRAARR